jgi:DNA-binding SARP family transcriptional activator
MAHEANGQLLWGSMERGVHIYLLGPIEVVCAGQQIPLRGQLQRALIAALASETGRVISAERLIETLWGAQPPSTARVKLQGHVSSLRKAFCGQTWSAGAGQHWPLITREPGYLFSANGVDVDLLDYRELVKLAACEIEAGRIAPAAEHLDDALGLWRGTAFADVRTPVVCSVAAALERGRMLAIERKAECDLQLGRYEMVVEQLTSILAVYPLREGSRASLMLALYRRGCRAEALECYRIGQRYRAASSVSSPGKRCGGCMS